MCLARVCTCFSFFFPEVSCRPLHSVGGGGGGGGGSNS